MNLFIGYGHSGCMICGGEHKTEEHEKSEKHESGNDYFGIPGHWGHEINESHRHEHEESRKKEKGEHKDSESFFY